VRELHVDFILQEEFFSNSHFLRRFIACANHPDEHSQVVSVQRSVSDALGEADIVVIYKGYEGKNTAILIEDKIRAAFRLINLSDTANEAKSGSVTHGTYAGLV